MPQSLIGKRVEILDKGWIELVDMMPHPDSDISGDLSIVNAARVSFLGESKGPERDKKTPVLFVASPPYVPVRNGRVQIPCESASGHLVAMGSASHLEHERAIGPLHTFPGKRLLRTGCLAKTEQGQ